MAERKPRQKRSLSRSQILSLALPRMQAGGVEAISFRRLAEALDVTPMAVKYHVGDQRALLADLVDLAFRDTLGELTGEGPQARLREILSRYCARACDHAHLLRCMLADAGLISAEIHAVSAAIRRETQMLNAGDPEDVLLNLLVDYTHGFVLSADAAQPGAAPGLSDYLRSVDYLLRAITPERA